MASTCGANCDWPGMAWCWGPHLLSSGEWRDERSYFCILFCMGNQLELRMELSNHMIVSDSGQKYGNYVIFIDHS